MCVYVAFKADTPLQSFAAEFDVYTVTCTQSAAGVIAADLQTFHWAIQACTVSDVARLLTRKLCCRMVGLYDAALGHIYDPDEHSMAGLLSLAEICEELQQQ